MLAGQQVPAGHGFATVLPDMDFETYSEAGYFFDDAQQKWCLVNPNGKTGIGCVGAAVYSEHPTTEVLSLAYDLKDGAGPRLWIPGMPPPQELFDHMARGGLIEAHNSLFEVFIWQNVCVKRMGWPSIPLNQYRCSQAKAKAFALPPGLDKLGGVLNAEVQKDKKGKNLLNRFSRPQNPKKKDLRLRVTPAEDPEGAAALYSYNIDDIRAEAAISSMIPDLMPSELNLWLLDQGINFRGVSIDEEALSHCEAIIEQAFTKYDAELPILTAGAVQLSTELPKIKKWLESRGYPMPSITKETLPIALADPALPPDCQRVLEIRALLGSASIKKVAAMRRRLCADGRIRDLFSYCGASRTSRWSGGGVQPQNISSGPYIWRKARKATKIGGLSCQSG